MSMSNEKIVEVFDNFCNKVKTINSEDNSIIEILDNVSNLKPSSDIWLKSKQAWFQPPKDTEHFDHQPNFKEFLNI